MIDLEIARTGEKNTSRIGGRDYRRAGWGGAYDEESVALNGGVQVSLRRLDASLREKLLDQGTGYSRAGLVRSRASDVGDYVLKGKRTSFEGGRIQIGEVVADGVNGGSGSAESGKSCSKRPE